MQDNIKKKSRFLSLTWKAILAVSIAILTSSGSVFIFGNLTLEKNYSQERDRVHRFYQQAFDSILQQSKLDQIDITWIIPAVISLDLSSQQALGQIEKIINANWFKIELESDIKSAYLFSKKGDLLNSWGDTVLNKEVFSPWLNYVFENEEPFEKILCSINCVQYKAYPFLHNGEFIGVFIFGRDLADMVLRMKAITGKEIGILVQNNENEIVSTKPTLDKWSKAIIALTEYEKSFPLLLAVMNKLPDSLPQKKARFEYNNNDYEIIIFPFSKDNNIADLVIIDNLSEELIDIHRSSMLYALSGAISLILAGVILLLLLIKPMRRLNAFIALLPWIAKKNYLKVNEIMPVSSGHKLFNDEIDILNNATQDLILTLKNLDRDVDLRTQRLAERSVELQQEKNLVSNILNTAQVIIIIIDNNGRIVMSNKYAEKQIGYSENELKRQLFVNLVFGHEDIRTISNAIEEISSQQRRTFRYECILFSSKGNELYISWFFTLIKNNKKIEILSVGLDLTERRITEKKLSWLADHDPLTNLYNRRRFDQELEHALTIANRYNQKGALILFDIDQFKNINDSSGHNVGDELLIKVADKLLSIIRDTDIVARLGGDEFVVISYCIDQDHAEKVVQKICTEIATVKVTVNNIDLGVTISAGMLIFPAPGFSSQELMATVDIAMYKAKQMGRGGWCLASMEDLARDEIRHRVNWKAKIEKALEEDRFILYYQPIMRIVDKSISHYECLLRMIDENGEIIPPGMFTGIAEHFGLITKIDQRVIDLAFKKQSLFIKQGLDIHLSINLSGEMLSNPNAFSIIAEHLDRWNVPAHKFIFEVLETQAVTNIQAARDFMTYVTNIGGKFALDDFGVGFSSMSHLKQLPVQYLKIDGGFIKNLANNREDQLFVKAINDVGQGMGIKTIAEFVENEAILKELSEMGVNYAQGYGIGKPMPEPQFDLHSKFQLQSEMETI
ncbi:EAL domain-containing protein [Methylobacter sp.]|uniref:bifunctional diguanylate cyclase/phosphodiesterase n=1 Tax=Methylobacter sp. TaxID=2051955 RepID=UPI003DA65843